LDEIVDGTAVRPLTAPEESGVKAALAGAAAPVPEWAGELLDAQQRRSAPPPAAGTVPDWVDDVRQRERGGRPRPPRPGRGE
jgi:hypothetical protein